MSPQRLKRRPWIALLLAATLAGAGCQSKTSPGHEDEEAHAEHHIPAHKPKDFPGAVKALRALNDAFKAGQIGGASPEANGAATPAIAMDVARWLPEIAADSDLPVEPWNKVDAISTALTSSYEVLAGMRKGDPREAVDSADGQIRELEGILSSAKPEWFEPPYKSRPAEDVGTD